MGLKKKEETEKERKINGGEIYNNIEKEKGKEKTKKNNEKVKNKKKLDSYNDENDSFTEDPLDWVNKPWSAKDNLPLWISVPMGLIPEIKPGSVEAKEIVEIERLGEEAIWGLSPPEVNLYDDYLYELTSEWGKKQEEHNNQEDRAMEIEEVEPPRYPEQIGRASCRERV